MPTPGPLELVLIFVIVTMLFGVGKLPEVFGAVGKGIREFRSNAADPDKRKGASAAEPTVAANNEHAPESVADNTSA